MKYECLWKIGGVNLEEIVLGEGGKVVIFIKCICKRVFV